MDSMLSMRAHGLFWCLFFSKNNLKNFAIFIGAYKSI